MKRDLRDEVMPGYVVAELHFDRSLGSSQRLGLVKAELRQGNIGTFNRLCGRRLFVDDVYCGFTVNVQVKATSLVSLRQRFEGKRIGSVRLKRYRTEHSKLPISSNRPALDAKEKAANRLAAFTRAPGQMSPDNGERLASRQSGLRIV